MHSNHAPADIQNRSFNVLRQNNAKDCHPLMACSSKTLSNFGKLFLANWSNPILSSSLNLDISDWFVIESLLYFACYGIHLLYLASEVCWLTASGFVCWDLVITPQLMSHPKPSPESRLNYNFFNRYQRNVNFQHQTDKMQQQLKPFRVG